MMLDQFQNVIDPVAGFARGQILRTSTEEGIRLRAGQRLAAEWVTKNGAGSVAIFTGNKRDFLVTPDDLETLCEEWVGPGLFAQDLASIAREHLGGAPEHEVAVFNRTSAAIIATILALSQEQPVLSVVPQRGSSHASVIRGARLANVPLTHIQVQEDWWSAIQQQKPRLIIITTVTSSLERMSDEAIQSVVAAAHKVGAVVLLDEAYGARLRTALHGGAASLKLGADLSVTNSDKAGLSGPRAGLLVGVADYVAAIQATGAGLGMEARAPVAAGVLRSLESFSPEDLRREAQEGTELSHALAASYPTGTVQTSDLGPMISEESVLADILRRSERQSAPIVPCEASAALGMVLLRDHGILTVNTHGQPGARVSLRLKPVAGAIDTVGGIDAVVLAIHSASNVVAEMLHDTVALERLILGGTK